MLYRAAQLVELTCEHAHFAGAPEEFIVWEPTVGCRGLLAGLRCLFRSTPNGAVLLYEVDTSVAGATAVVPLPLDAELTLVGRALGSGFAGYTDLPISRGRVFHLSNAEARVDGAALALHPGEFLSAAEQVRLTPASFLASYTTAEATAVLEIQRVGGRVVFREALVALEGRVSAWLDLGVSGPGLYEARLEGARQERFYADSDLISDPPLVVASLKARVAIPPPFALVDGAGEPRLPHRAFMVRFAAAARVWRYVIIPKDSPEVEEPDLRVEDHGDAGGPRFTFASLGPKAPLQDGTPAVIFESAAAIPVMHIPYRGVQLLRRRDPIPDFVVETADLPNPVPGSLSLASGPGRPVVEASIYV